MQDPVVVHFHRHSSSCKGLSFFSEYFGKFVLVTFGIVFFEEIFYQFVGSVKHPDAQRRKRNQNFTYVFGRTITKFGGDPQTFDNF